MPNKFGIPDDVEKRIRQRDTVCVYCREEMMYPCIGNDRRKWATIEHFNEEGPFYWEKGLREGDLAICCQSCNSSRGKRKLLDWFKTPYCREKNINEETVGSPVKIYIKLIKSYDSMNHKKEPTRCEQLLYNALVKRGVEAVLGYNDGHKTVDIAVLPARMFIEVDDLGHFTDPDQIMRDFKRHHFSDGDDFDTFYVTNQIIEHYVDKVADALVEVVKRRIP